MLDIPLDEDEATPVVVSSEKMNAEQRQFAQGVHCGEFALAFNFEWARQILDEFELVPIPRAPSWVLGAVSASGLILPVVDIANYFSGLEEPAQLLRGQRLLVGGIHAEDAEGALAIAFSLSPVQLDYFRQSVDTSTLPTRLQDVCISAVSDHAGKIFLEIDTVQLMVALSAELSAI